jgi:hypothetical protein
MLTKREKIKRATEILRPSQTFLTLPFEEKRKLYRVITMLIKMRVV